MEKKSIDIWKNVCNCFESFYHTKSAKNPIQTTWICRGTKNILAVKSIILYMTLKGKGMFQCKFQTNVAGLFLSNQRGFNGLTMGHL